MITKRIPQEEHVYSLDHSHIPSEIVCLAMPNPSSYPSDFAAAVARGRRLWDKLAQRLNDPTRVDVSLPPLFTHYVHDIVTDSVSLPENVESVLGAENINKSSDGWTLDLVGSRVPESELAYTLYNSSEEGCIIALDVDKDKDLNSPLDRIQLSNVMFSLYQANAQKFLHPLGDLKFIWTHYIQNEKTPRFLTTIKELWGEGNLDLCYQEFRPDDDPFFALLGSPSMGYAAHILIDHATALRCKTIESIRLVRQDPRSPTSSTIYATLVDAPSPAKALSSPLKIRPLRSSPSKKELRANKKDQEKARKAADKLANELKENGIP